MTLAGSPARAPRHALLVGSNPAVTRVFRTYLQREGVRCHEATPEAVLRASEMGLALASLDPRTPVAVTLIVASAGMDVSRVQSALESTAGTKGSPVLVVESLASDGVDTTVGHSSSASTLSWPFRLRDVMDALVATVAARQVPAVLVRPARRQGDGARLTSPEVATEADAHVPITAQVVRP